MLLVVESSILGYKQLDSSRKEEHACKNDRVIWGNSLYEMHSTAAYTEAEWIYFALYSYTEHMSLYETSHSFIHSLIQS